jgi:hypothetical protein
MSVIRRVLSVALAPLLLSISSAAACYLSAGASLGAFLGGVIMVTLLVPPLVVADERWRTRLIVLGAILLPMWAMWGVVTVNSPPSSKVYVREWAASCVVLAAYGLALMGVAVMLRLTRLPAVGCAAVAVVLGLAWLTWPIYMSRSWEGTASAGVVSFFARFNPALVINGQVFRALGLWTEQSIAYRLTDLSQNVPYALPQSIFPCVLLHGLVGGGVIGVCAWIRSLRRGRLP